MTCGTISSYKKPYVMECFVNFEKKGKSKRKIDHRFHYFEKMKLSSASTPDHSYIVMS